jgi:putative oxidoreductase
MSILSKLNALLAKTGDCLQSPLLLVIRFYWGWQFFLTGRGKLMHLEKTTGFFASLNIPAPKLSAILASTTECTCGILLLLGLFSRFASPALIVVMCMAYATANSEALHAIFSDTDKFLGADPFLFLFASLIVFAFGPGRFSLDALLLKGKKA